ncbi:hypothetical protein GCM10010172_20200 [Paractinoplanes ferrugineus]|uniref:Uncharacterized protein n=1 Tax=Paractinoplanes ferrugineus TaxID=113564 RepID=A0A919IYJ3_9ACTN|nr:hypothetical protein [Actinoplanes ferrugineus]GIE09069.1 hypothetical protein Afe05nite_09090 [Actinoplanes ferrugineus]
MSLTGLPLILLTWVLAIVAVAATVRWWRLPGRRRVPVRVAGLVAIEVLVVAGVGLIVNRQDSFYPSWAALGGLHSVVTTSAASVGRLDGKLDNHAAVTWSPPQAAAWHLAAPPQLLAPPDYAEHADRRFPIIVMLTSAGAAHQSGGASPGAGASGRGGGASGGGAGEVGDPRPVAGVVVVVLRPTGATTGTALADLPAALGQDARVTDRLAILVDPAWMRVAKAWPGHPPVIAGHDATALAAAARELPAPLAAPERLPS